MATNLNELDFILINCSQPVRTSTLDMTQIIQQMVCGETFLLDSLKTHSMTIPEGSIDDAFKHHDKLLF